MLEEKTQSTKNEDVTKDMENMRQHVQEKYENVKCANEVDIVPLQDYVLVEPIETSPSKTESGIILPDRASEGIKSIKGTILKCGSGVKNKHLEGGVNIVYTQRVKIRAWGHLVHFVKEEHIIGTLNTLENIDANIS